MTVIADTTAPKNLLSVPVPPSLTTLYLYVSSACNLACRHCYIMPQFLGADSRSMPEGTFIKLEYVQKIIEQGKPLGLQTIKLTGGEPTIHPQFRDLVTLIHEAGIGSFMETNGMLIDVPLAHHLKANGIWFVSCSLDGANRQTHDYIRGVEGAFDRALTGIRALVEAEYRPQVIATIHKLNVGEWRDIVALAQNLGCSSVKFNTVQKVGRGVSFAEKYGLSVPAILDFYHELESLNQDSGIKILADMPIAFHKLGAIVNQRCGRCAVLNLLGLLASGELSLCGVGVVTDSLIFGHIEHDNLADVWHNNPTLQLLRQQVPAELEGICAECIHAEGCLGHCIANTQFKTGKLNAANEFCQVADDLGLFPVSRKR